MRNSIPSPLVVEMIGYAGYDFVILDMEHVCVNPETLENMVLAAECAGMTRVMEDEFIAASGTDVTDAFRLRAKPVAKLMDGAN